MIRTSAALPKKSQPVRLRKISSDSNKLRTSFHYQTAIVMHACEKLLRHYQFQQSKRMDKNGKVSGYYRGHKWTTWFLWKGGVNRQIFIVGCLQRKHLHVALCLTRYGVSTMARQQHSGLSMSGTASPLENGSLKSSTSSKSVTVMYRPWKTIC